MTPRQLVVAACAALAVPFLVTGMFRLAAPDWVVVATCAAVGCALLLRPGTTRAAGAGWLAGCALWAVALLVLLNAVGDGLSSV